MRPERTYYLVGVGYGDLHNAPVSVHMANDGWICTARNRYDAERIKAALEAAERNDAMDEGTVWVAPGQGDTFEKLVMALKSSQWSKPTSLKLTGKALTDKDRLRIEEVERRISAHGEDKGY